MLLNRVEKALMNNPVRAAIQRHFEARRLLALGGRVGVGPALEIGCGRGVGLELILDLFGAERVVGIDLDPEMVDLARVRVRRRGERAAVAVGDAVAIAAEEATYAAVFDFGILHHVPDWRRALREVFRVLRPGGRFFAEEPLGAFIQAPVLTRLLDHPAEGAFTLEQFVDALREAGFTPHATAHLGPFFGWVVADRPGA